MSYLVQSILARDPHIIDRVTACAAMESTPDPQAWAFDHAWQLSAQPRWGETYASALAAFNEWSPEDGTPQPPPPGANEAAITDAQILAAVQALREPSE